MASNTQETADDMTFQQAVEVIDKLTVMPSDTDALQLYGLFKIASGNDFSAAKKPSLFEGAGVAYAKYSAWKTQVDNGVTVEEAKKKYIELAKEFKTKYKYDPNKAPKKRCS